MIVPGDTLAKVCKVSGIVSLFVGVYDLIKLVCAGLINNVSNNTNWKAQMTVYVVGAPSGQGHIVNQFIGIGKYYNSLSHLSVFSSSCSTNQAVICSCQRCCTRANSSR